VCMAITARGSKRKFAWSMFIDAGYRISDRELRCRIRGCTVGTVCPRPDSEQWELSRAVKPGYGAAGKSALYRRPLGAIFMPGSFVECSAWNFRNVAICCQIDADRLRAGQQNTGYLMQTGAVTTIEREGFRDLRQLL
jgi:hypothetical protein